MIVIKMKDIIISDDDNVEAVKFEDLPDDWVCPLCGLGKVLFLLLFAQNFDNIKQM